MKTITLHNKDTEIRRLELDIDKCLGFISKNHLDKLVWKAYKIVEESREKIKQLKS